jgi:hypothetical protein
MKKIAGIDTSQDAPSGLFQRRPEALLTEGAEQSNVAITNQLLDDLFSRRDELEKKSYSQLSNLFTNKEHYGKGVRLGMSADEASKLVTRAFHGDKS